MAESVLTTISTINKGLLSALLPTTFIEDFKLYPNRIMIYLVENITDLLPQVEVFLDALSEVTETKFYLEMVTPKIGILRTYGIPELCFNP
ncbi:MAG: hypothetical protein ACXAB2_07265, partial [Candidatus Hodarchaeales archaeon]